MKSFLSKNKKLLAISLIGFFIFSSGVAFAYTSQDWVIKATAWANTNCVNPTAATKQKAFFCYLWSKSNEQQTAIDSLNSANSTKTTQIGDLQGKAKNIWVYDQNNSKLGLFVLPHIRPNSFSETNYATYFFDTTINRIVPVTHDGRIGDIAQVYFKSIDCTGTPYFSVGSAADFIELRANMLLVSTNRSRFFIFSDHPVEDNSDPTGGAVRLYSQLIGGSCGLYDKSGGYQLTEVFPNYGSSVQLPFIFKYE